MSERARTAMRTAAFALALGLAFPSWSADANALLKKVDRNLEPESYEMYRKLINIEPDGSRKEFVLYSVKKGRDKVVALFLEPASDKGRATLRSGDNMWLYIPNVGKPVRITSLQSVVGGVFNNADILRIDYAAEYEAESVEEEKDAQVLALKARTAEVAYDRLKMWVDRRTLLPVKIEAYAATGLLIKTLHFRDVKDFGGGIRRPATVETDSPLFKGYRSVMLYSQLKRREVPDEAFTLNYLPRVPELRK
jgi:outer membrane lipoprotein-sorting protein